MRNELVDTVASLQGIQAKFSSGLIPFGFPTQWQVTVPARLVRARKQKSWSALTNIRYRSMDDFMPIVNRTFALKRSERCYSVNGSPSR